MEVDDEENIFKDIVKDQPKTEGSQICEKIMYFFEYFVLILLIYKLQSSSGYGIGS